MADETSLTALRDDAVRRIPNPPELADLIEDAGRQRLATYYLYSALLAGVIDGPELAPARWPGRMAEPMQRLGLARWAPRTWPGLDAQLIPAEQHLLRSEDRRSEFAQLLVGLINGGAFGPLCGAADSVRLAGQSGELELMRAGRVAGTCKVADHWELVAQHLAGAPLLGPESDRENALAAEHSVQNQLKETGISHAVSVGTNLAVNIHPLGAAVGLGTRLVRARIETGRNEAGTLRDLGQELGDLYAQANRELAGLHERRAPLSPVTPSMPG